LLELLHLRTSLPGFLDFLGLKDMYTSGFSTRFLIVVFRSSLFMATFKGYGTPGVLAGTIRTIILCLFSWSTTASTHQTLSDRRELFSRRLPSVDVRYFPWSYRLMWTDRIHTGTAYSSWLSTTEPSSLLFPCDGPLTFGMGLASAAADRESYFATVSM